MPKMTHYWNFLLINLLFLSQLILIYYWFMLADIKKNWNEYRCNPLFMPFADNIEENFTYCVQNMQMNYMSYILQPLNYISSTLVDIGNNFNVDINGIRNMISVIRDFVSNIIESIFGVFMNLIVEMQKMTISIKDLVGKIIGVITVLLYVLSGSLQTMESLWNGPPGQMVKALGKGCFHPTTKLKMINGDLKEIQNLIIGDILKDGSIIDGIIKLKNRSKEEFYELIGEEVCDEKNKIYITGEHFIKWNKKFIKMKDYDLEMQKNKTTIKINKKKYSDILYNLITDTHIINIGNYIFWDWEDDELNNQITK